MRHIKARQDRNGLALTAVCCHQRDMTDEEAIELGRRSIYHATFRDAVSGGTVSGAPPSPPPLFCPPTLLLRALQLTAVLLQCTW